MGLPDLAELLWQTSMPDLAEKLLMPDLSVMLDLAADLAEKQILVETSTPMPDLSVMLDLEADWPRCCLTWPRSRECRSVIDNYTEPHNS